MTHLGTLISALVDGELSHDQRDRALAHIATCDPCRAAVEAERALKATVGIVEFAAPSSALMSSLMRLAEPGEPLPPLHRGFPGSGGSTTAGWRFPTARPAAGMNRRVAFAAGGLMSVAAVTVGLAFAGGAAVSSDDGTPVVPPVEELTVEHVQRSGGQPFADPVLFLDESATTATTSSSR